MRKRLGCALVFLACACGSTDQETVAVREDHAYVKANNTWPSGQISVCFKDSGWYREKALVRAAVEGAYENRPQFYVDFTGWEDCSSAAGFQIQIKIRDERPHSEGLGTQIAYGAGYLVFNFFYGSSWPTVCPGKTYDQCIGIIAIHEFGHALGLSHEQNRPDTPAWCNDVQGSNGNYITGPWDPASIMNYCNATYAGGGVLSQGDVEGLSRFYGGYGAPKYGDFDGDGKMDRLYRSNDGSYNWLIIYGKGGAWDRKNFNWCFAADHHLKIGDWNGDGRDDLLCHKHSEDGHKWIAAATPQGTFTGTTWEAPMYWCYGGGNYELHAGGDFNSDGRADLLCHNRLNGQVWILYGQSAYGGSFTVDPSGSEYVGAGICYGAGQKLYVGDGDDDGRQTHSVNALKRRIPDGDVNGDGQTDLLCHRSTDGWMYLMLAHSTGPKFSTIDWVSSTKWCSSPNTLHQADYNGDFRSDLVCHSPITGENWLSAGKQYVFYTGTDGYHNVGWCTGADRIFSMADLDGNRKADLLCDDTIDWRHHWQTLNGVPWFGVPAWP